MSTDGVGGGGGGSDPFPCRVAGHGDIPHLRDIERRAGAPFVGIGMAAVADDPPPPVAFYAEAVSGGLAWVAGAGAVTGGGRGEAPDGGGPVGYLVARVVDGTLYVEQVSVVPEAARHRVGAGLLDRAADEARERGLAAVTLTTFADVPWNAPYYRRLGFRVLDGDLPPGLAAQREEERRGGLDAWPRVTMIRPV